MRTEYTQLFTILWGLWNSSCEKKNEGACWLGVVFAPFEFLTPLLVQLIFF